jgi:hypothetical protein
VPAKKPKKRACLQQLDGVVEVNPRFQDADDVPAKENELSEAEAESEDSLPKMKKVVPPRVGAFYTAEAGCRRRGIDTSQLDNDPIDDDAEVCFSCGKPEDDENPLMCCDKEPEDVDDDHLDDLTCCGRWWHPVCISRFGVPPESYAWLCQNCTNFAPNKQALGLQSSVDQRGYEFPYEITLVKKKKKRDLSPEEEKLNRESHNCTKDEPLSEDDSGLDSDDMAFIDDSQLIDDIQIQPAKSAKSTKSKRKSKGIAKSNGKAKGGAKTKGKPKGSDDDVEPDSKPAASTKRTTRSSKKASKSDEQSDSKPSSTTKSTTRKRKTRSDDEDTHEDSETEEEVEAADDLVDYNPDGEEGDDSELDVDVKEEQISDEPTRKKR